MKGGSRSQKSFINRHQSHLREPDLTQREVPSDFFRDVRNHGLLLVSCCLQTQVEFNT